MFELGAAVETDAGDAHDGERHRQHVAFFASGVVAGRAKDGSHGAVGEGLRVELCGFEGRAVVPDTEGVLGGQGRSPFRAVPLGAWVGPTWP